MGRSPGNRRWPWIVGSMIVVALVGGAGILSNPPGDSSAASDQVVPGLDSFDFPIAQVGWALGIIVLLIVVLALLARKVMRLPVGTGRSGRHMRVIETLPLGGRRLAMLLLVHDRALIVGIDDGRMSTLGEISDAEFVRTLTVPPDTDRSFASHFLSQQESFEDVGGERR